MEPKITAWPKKLWLLITLLIFGGLWLWIKFGQLNTIQPGDTTNYQKLGAIKESCVQCHLATSGYSKFHDPQLIGCVSCHLGNPQQYEKEEAHQGMVLIPGNLSDAAQTCGTCHPNELDKVSHSLMTTNSGLVAVDKFVFGETDSPDHAFDIRKLGHSMADDHLRNLCANCHLGAEKDSLGPVNQLSRGGGCNACHLNYSEQAARQLTAYLESNKTILPKVHPSTDIFMGDENCFGCHSRSSRISTNYMGWHETLLDEKDVSDEEEFRVFEDKRVYQYVGEDAHHAKGMLCIDCHSSHEVMGDGKLHLHEEDAVSVSCADCHVKEEPLTIGYEDLDTESKLVFMHRDYSHTDKKMLVAGQDRHPLVNTYIDTGGIAVLLGKKEGKPHVINKQGSACSRDMVHQSVSCASCHSQWTPRCIGCHNSYEPDQKGYDLLDKKLVQGTWMEHVFEFGHGLPSLGVRTTDEGDIVEPAVPGMILTIDPSNHSEDQSSDLKFSRLYAPNAPHTTSKQARECSSCHISPSALGYGKGELVFKRRGDSGKWFFVPEYALNVIDSLPEDAWIPFLKPIGGQPQSTRSDFRPLNLVEQQNILRVGTCLQCHEPDSEVMTESLISGLEPLVLKLSDQCAIPVFD